ncbi:MAG: hypothetical protein K1060chlam1_00208 [Candidatus Anoxychlamydiales bacterium]|nr:hypothetical protein [Candidatus Anoxychlamydiales bacterium]
MSSSVKAIIPEDTKFYFRLDENNNIQELRVKEKSSQDTSSTDKKVATKVVALFEDLETAPQKPIKELKEKLEALIKSELNEDLEKLFEGHDSSIKGKDFKIIFSETGVKIQRKTTIPEKSKTTSNENIFDGIKTFLLGFLSKPSLLLTLFKKVSSDPKLEKRQITISSEQFSSKINEIFSSFVSSMLTEKSVSLSSQSIPENADQPPKTPKLTKIRDLTAAHNIEQLKAAPNANKTVTKLLLTALTIGFLAGIIGIGAIMPHLGIASLTALGIPGIPASIAIPLLGIGVLTLASCIGLKIASKTSEKAKNYLDAMFLLKSNLFLESNLNDFTNSALFILMTLTMISASWLTTLKGCLAYPTGALLIASGLYQLGESIKSMVNNKKIGDIKEMIISTLNVLSSGAVIAMGILTAIGMINAPITVAVMFIFGVLMVTVNAYNLYKSIKQLKEINKVDPENETGIFKFLKKKLSLDENEKKDIKDKIKAMSKPELLKWIEKNLKNFEKEQAEIFEQIKIELEKAKDEEKANVIEAIKKLIINEEIKNAIESKIEGFGSIVNKETLIESLEAYANYEDRLNCSGELKPDLIALFKKIKKDTTGKTVAEIIKFAIINIPMIVIPSLQNMKLISTTLYNYLMAGGLLTNIGVNITPRYRNIPPTVIKKILDINNALDNKTYATYKKRNITSISEGNATTDKANAVAENSIELEAIAQ